MRARAEECLELALEADYRRGAARARWVLGSTSYIEHDFRAARPLLEASIAAARELGDHWATVLASTWLGHLNVDEGDLPAAAALFGRTLELGEQLGDKEISCLFLEGAAHLAAAADQLSGRYVWPVRRQPSVSLSMRPQSVEFVVHRGFAEHHRRWASCLALSQARMERFAGASQRVARQGITIVSFAEEDYLPSWAPPALPSVTHSAGGWLGEPRW